MKRSAGHLYLLRNARGLYFDVSHFAHVIYDDAWRCISIAVSEILSDSVSRSLLNVFNIYDRMELNICTPSARTASGAKRAKLRRTREQIKEPNGNGDESERDMRTGDT